MKILIVEDEHKIANSIKKGLEQERFTTDVAFDGAIGFTVFLEQPHQGQNKKPKGMDWAWQLPKKLLRYKEAQFLSRVKKGKARYSRFTYQRENNLYYTKFLLSGNFQLGDVE